MSLFTRSLRKFALGALFLPMTLALWAEPPRLRAGDVPHKLNEIMRLHAKHRELDAVLVQRALENFINSLDPAKTYFTKGEVESWLEAPSGILQQALAGYGQGSFTAFEAVYEQFDEAVARRGRLEQLIHAGDLPESVSAEEFKDLDWAEDEEELLTRLRRLRSLQVEVSLRVSGEDAQQTLERLDKRRRRFETRLLGEAPELRQRILLGNVLKATASALDSQTAYLTPEEAEDFLVQLQQRLFGIGVQLRDSLDGFQIVRVLEGGPAFLQGELRAEDRIIAIDGEPVVGQDILDAVQLIRGRAGTPVELTVLRTHKNAEGSYDEQLAIEIIRDEVLLTETRVETTVEPFGDGAIGHISLYSFYQDSKFSAESDLREAIEELTAEHNLKGIVLDLRLNAGGLLPQAVGVAGLFITKGIVCSIKDGTGKVQHLRETNGQVAWEGPLVVLVSRASASASEIVAQTLQDYGRALVVGDETTFGKGTFQVSTIDAVGGAHIDPKGEYKVTRGAYYTVSGKSPQLDGVQADIVVPGIYSELELGERFAKFPLEPDHIPANFQDDLSDIPFIHRAYAMSTYRYGLQPRMDSFTRHLELLRANSAARLSQNPDYQVFMQALSDPQFDEERSIASNDFQLIEAYAIMKDLIYLVERERERRAA